MGTCQARKGAALLLTVDWSDVALSAGLSAAVLLLFVLFYHKLFAITFDESFSRATGCLLYTSRCV